MTGSTTYRWYLLINHWPFQRRWTPIKSLPMLTKIEVIGNWPDRLDTISTSTLLVDEAGAYIVILGGYA